jgi:arsenite methyltransferase
MDKDQAKQIVKDYYGKVASKKSCYGSRKCSAQISKEIGYTDEEINLALEANLGLGCGNPTAIARIKDGDVVLDLGSGAGFDCFLASKKVGGSGKVIGVDMTEEMIIKARGIAQKNNYNNVEFKLGDIENLPIENNSIDVVISNCVINLAPDKEKVFKEAYRVLKPGGRMYVSDIVLLKELPSEILNNPELLAGCVSGALLKDEYIQIINNAGFVVNILSEDKEISKSQYKGIPLESLKVEAVKK